jgi:hypothetical protein
MVKSPEEEILAAENYLVSAVDRSLTVSQRVLPAIHSLMRVVRLALKTGQIKGAREAIESCRTVANDEQDRELRDFLNDGFHRIESFLSDFERRLLESQPRQSESE